MNRTTNDLRLLAILDRMLAAGEPQPKNLFLCEALGLQTPSDATSLVQSLRNKGFIAVEYLTRNHRIIAVTDRGRQKLAAHAREMAEEASRPPMRCRAMPVFDPGPGFCGDQHERQARGAAFYANQRFMAAMAKVSPVPDAADRDNGRFNRLPPPTLTGQSFS